MTLERQALGTRLAIVIALGAVLGLAATVLAQSEGLRELPAAAAPPDDVAEMQKAQKVQLPAPSERSKVKALPASAKPPKDFAEIEAEHEKKIPAPPSEPTSVEALAEKIRSLPGGAEKLEKAKKGEHPGKRVGPRSSSSWKDIWQFVSTAHAASTFSAMVAPTVTGSNGARGGLHSTNLRAYAVGAYVGSSMPNNNYIWIFGNSTSYVDGTTSRTTNPYVVVRVNIPSTEWYNVNVHAAASGTVKVYHYETSGKVLIATHSTQSGWQDYPVLEYLAAGWHYFYWVFSSSANVAHVNVHDPY